MKKLLTLMLGLSFLAGTATMTFAGQDQTPQKKEKKKSSKKKKADKKTEQR